jgi:hypothetical protein
MRFPDMPFMKRTFDLARNRGLRLKLIKYILQMVAPMANTFLHNNTARTSNQVLSIKTDPFYVSDYITDPMLGKSTRRYDHPFTESE